MMLLRILALLLIAISPPAIGQESSASRLTQETMRFVRAYRIDKVAQIGVATAKDALEADVAQGKANREAAKCFLNTYTYDAYLDNLTSAVSLHFRDLETLKSLNDFLESPAGTKMLDQMFEPLTRSPAMMYAIPSAAIKFTDDERNVISQFEASRAAREFSGFIVNSLPIALKQFKIYVLTKCKQS